MKFEIPQEVLDYVNLIDTKYAEAKLAKTSRFDVEWGKWSREMNIATKGKSSLAYRYLFIYWIVKSQLLELHFKTRFKQANKKRLAREANQIKKYILNGDAPDISDDELKRRLFQSMK